MIWTIRNTATGERMELVRDVRHIHPDWVHAQCDTKSEAELQYMIDQYDAMSYIGTDGSWLGEDICGIEPDESETRARIREHETNQS